MIFRHPAPPSGSGSTSERESTGEHDVSIESLQARIEELEKALETERKQFRAEMRKGQEAIDRMRKGPAAPERAAQERGAPQPTHVWDDGYDVVAQQRVAVFVDVQNMYYAARNLYNSKLEFAKLLRALARGRLLSRAIAYIVERPGMEQDKFIEVLRRNGYEVYKKVLIERADGSQRGDWDIGIALDMVTLAESVDAMVLVTGDGDFAPLCHFLRSRGVRVEVASFPDSTAAELIKSCETFHRLDEKILLPGAQFQNPPEGAGDRAEARERSGEARERERTDNRERTERDREPPESEEEARARGRRKRARGPLDDDFAKDEFQL